MRHFEADHGNAATVTGKGAFDGARYRPGEKHYFAKVAFGQVEKLVDLCFWYYERMSFPQGKDIKESEEPVVLRYFVRRYFSRDDL